MLTHKRNLRRCQCRAEVLALAPAALIVTGAQPLTGQRLLVRDVACALNEGGGSSLKVGKRIFYTCQSAEKGVCRTVWRAQAAGGHASQPRADISTLKLSQALCRLGDGHVGARVAM